MRYRLIHNRQRVIDIIEATGVTCSNSNEIIEGSLKELYQIIINLNLTNTAPMSAFYQ
jgi:hypothetical protein